MASASSSMSTRTARPVGPAARASSRVTCPSPQPTSKHVHPALTPTRERNAAVASAITRAWRARRSASARPPSIAYPRRRLQPHAVAHLGGEGRRGCRGQLGDRILRAVVRSRFRGRDHARPSIAFTNKAESSNVLPPADKQHVADVLEDDAQVMSDARLEKLLAGQPEEIQDEIISINTDARHLALQVALRLTLLARLIGLLNRFRMMRLPDPQPSTSVEGVALG
jgi:hypothetical protein